MHGIVKLARKQVGAARISRAACEDASPLPGALDGYTMTDTGDFNPVAY